MKANEKYFWREPVSQSAHSPAWYYWTGDSFRPTSCETMCDLRRWQKCEWRKRRTGFFWLDVRTFVVTRSRFFKSIGPVCWTKINIPPRNLINWKVAKDGNFVYKSEQAGSVGSISELYSARFRFDVVPDTDFLDTFPFLDSWPLVDGTDTLCRNVGNVLPLLAA